MKDDLKLYFVLFAIHTEKEWAAHAGYIFAKCEENIKQLLDAIYGPVYVRWVNEVQFQEGTILYGSQWRNIQ